jgi:hypothetical protein
MASDHSSIRPVCLRLSFFIQTKNSENEFPRTIERRAILFTFGSYIRFEVTGFY